MVRTQIQLTDEQARKLKRAADEEKVSASAFIRRVLDQALAARNEADDADLRQRAKAMAGSLHSGTGDLSARHDDYLAEAYAE